jgi:hypothetical protein
MSMRVAVPSVLLLLSLAVRAESVATPLFVIDVPEGWTIEDNKSSMVLIMGDRVRDRMPMPFLSVQYCFANEPAQGSFQRRCEEPCSEKRLTSQAEVRGMRLSPVVKDVSAQGVTQYRTHAISPREPSAFAALLCSNTGQVYVSLVSDEPRKEAEAMFNDVVLSLRWNRP